LLAAYGLIGSSTEAASVHGGKITPDVADYAFAIGSVGFANAWIAIASFSLSSGWVILSTRILERWMGWWLVATGVGLVASRFVWTSELWTLPYLLFWLWMLVLSVRLLRRPSLPDLSHDLSRARPRPSRSARSDRKALAFVRIQLQRRDGDSSTPRKQASPRLDTMRLSDRGRRQRQYRSRVEQASGAQADPPRGLGASAHAHRPEAPIRAKPLKPSIQLASGRPTEGSTYEGGRRRADAR
jgi:hypothetical protein